MCIARDLCIEFYFVLSIEGFTVLTAILKVRQTWHEMHRLKWNPMSNNFEHKFLLKRF